MKAFTFLSISLFLLLASCSSSPENNAKSTPVDSTNINGTVPVKYGTENPTDTTSVLPPADSGRSANTSTKQGE